MEYLIFRRLWRWSKRRHPNKGVEWVRKKYFHALGTRNWVFAIPVPQSDGSMGLLDLYDLSGTEIRRHNKVKGAYNPFDPMWENSTAKSYVRDAWQLDALPAAVGNVVSLARRSLRTLWLCSDGRDRMA